MTSPTHNAFASRSYLTSATGIPVALAKPAITATFDVESYSFEFSMKPTDTFADTHTKTFSEPEG